MSLHVGNRLPTFAVVEDAAHHDSMRSDALCAGLRLEPPAAVDGG